MTVPTAADFLLGSGAKGKSVKFPAFGSSITGTVAREPEVRQQVDPETNKPEHWDDGQPKWQIVVALSTEQRSAEIADDDGTRFLYVKGSKDPASQSLHSAVAGAVSAAGAKALEIGGQLTVTYIADGPKPTTGVKSAAKKYTASYRTAAETALGVQPHNGQPDVPVAASPVPAPMPANTPEINAAFANLTAEQRQQALAAMTPAQIAALFPTPA